MNLTEFTEQGFKEFILKNNLTVEQSEGGHVQYDYIELPDSTCYRLDYTYYPYADGETAYNFEPRTQTVQLNLI